MPVMVPLVDLVRIEGTNKLWPKEFCGFIAAIHRDPGERTNYGACADWLEEDSVNEPLLAVGFKFLHHVKTVRAYKTYQNWWRVSGAAKEVTAHLPKKRKGWPGIAWLAADLGEAVMKAREALETQLKAIPSVRT